MLLCVASISRRDGDTGHTEGPDAVPPDREIADDRGDDVALAADRRQAVWRTRSVGRHPRAAADGGRVLLGPGHSPRSRLGASPATPAPRPRTCRPKPADVADDHRRSLCARTDARPARPRGPVTVATARRTSPSTSPASSTRTSSVRLDAKRPRKPQSNECL